MEKKSSILSKYLDGIQNYLEFENDTEREKFLRELYKVPNVEQQFQEQMSREWRELAKNIRPKFFLEEDRAYTGRENAIKLYIYNIVKSPVPVIKVEKGSELQKEDV